MLEATVDFTKPVSVGIAKYTIMKSVELLETITSAG